MHPISILTVVMNLSKRKKRKEEVTDGQTDGQIDRQRNRKIRKISFMKVAQKSFYEGGINVFFLLYMALMSFF